MNLSEEFKLNFEQYNFLFVKILLCQENFKFDYSTNQYLICLFFRKVILFFQL